MDELSYEQHLQNAYEKHKDSLLLLDFMGRPERMTLHDFIQMIRTVQLKEDIQSPECSL